MNSPVSNQDEIIVPSMKRSKGRPRKSKRSAQGGNRSSGIFGVPAVRNGLLAIVVIVVGYILLGKISPYRDLQFSQVGVYVIALAGLSLLVGQSGQITLGQGAVMMVGAYTTALVNKHLNLAFPLEILLSAIVAGLFGILVGIVAARLRGPYLAGVTLSIALALPELASKFSSIFGGDAGLIVSPPNTPAFLGATYTQQRFMVSIVLVVTVLVIFGLANLYSSRQGRKLRAVRDDEVSAELNGIPLAGTQITAFMIASVCAGIAGSLQAMVAQNAGPESFTVALSISLLAAIVIGGVGTLGGAVWGGLALVFIPQFATDYSQRLNLSQGVVANLALAIYGLLLIAVILVFPGGVQGGLLRLAKYISIRFRSRGSSEIAGGLGK
ncbi:MAG: branched-chain amino acid ABC transporter permease [Acidimicrobiaceae bacterium]|nr:branched-chain amino acid ABC transporter permease [Acidimicrobiaceae bacterium]